MGELKYIFSKKFDETYTIAFTNGPQELINNGYIFKPTEPLNNISIIKSFSDDVEGETENVYFKKYFKYNNGDNWTELIPIEEIQNLELKHCQIFDFELHYYITVDDTSQNNKLYVNNIFISGDYKLSVYDSEAQLANKGDNIILAPSDTYKIFSLSNFQIISTPHNYYDVKFRFTQDNGRTYTPWENLTSENLSTHKLSPLRFAKVEYNIINNSDQGLIIYDIILEGDFQNISANYLKTNRYGLKQDCLTNLLNTPGMPGSDNTNNNFYTSCLGSYKTNTDVTLELENQSADNTSSMWNPYQFEKITQFSNFLGNQISKIFGWNVKYHLTDPDKNGTDMYLHEYTLKNIVSVKNIKVIVPENKFPIESLIINQFNLDLFDTFEIHIMKDDFKNTFGITKRPSEDDIIYICEANMLYYIKHSQAFKDIMNAATYYKIILEKYEYKSNIRDIVDESIESIKKLTSNTTIDDLLGSNNREEEEKIANKEQTYPTIFDKIRHKISTNVNIIKEKIVLENFEILKQYYDLSNKLIKNKTAINYTKIDQTLKKSDNRTFIFWVNFNNSYDETRRPNKKMFDSYNIKQSSDFNFLNNYSSDNIGYNIHYNSGKIFIKVNDKTYSLSVDLLTNIWYQVVINLDQRQETLNINIYKRNTIIKALLFDMISFKKEEVEIYSSDYEDLINNGYKCINNIEDNISTDFELITSETHNITPTHFNHNESLKILGSDIKYSNLRIFDEVIPTKNIKNILKEYIIKDENHNILVDNAQKKLTAKVYHNKYFK